MFEDTTFDDLDEMLVEGINLVNQEDARDQGRQDDKDEELGSRDTKVFNAKEDVSTTLPVTTADMSVTTASTTETTSVEVSTADLTTPSATKIVFDEDEDVTMAMAQTLMKLKSDKVKEKGVAIRDLEESETERPARSVLTLKPVPKIDPKDKGKGVIKEEPEPVKVKSKDQGEAQIERDAEIALMVQAEFDEEARLERQRQEQASLVYIASLYDEAQARIDADNELAVRWTQEEQEKYTMDERAKLLAEYFENRKKYGVEYDYYKVFKSDGSSKYINTFTKMVTRFDRLNLYELHSLVKQRFESTTPEGIDLILWGDLKTMFETSADIKLWKNQEDWILKSWTFYENCGVQILLLEGGIEIPMLAEKRYLLIKETLERMLVLSLTVKFVSDVDLDLISFDDKDWMLKIIKDYKETKELKFIKEKLEE
ncbi:hypothetical protein Tco_1362716 [Tanacetum coccineum]